MGHLPPLPGVEMLDACAELIPAGVSVQGNVVTVEVVPVDVNRSLSVSEVCGICRQHCGGKNLLSNGGRYHNECVSEAQMTVATLDRRSHELKVEMQRHERALMAERSVLGLIKRWMLSRWSLEAELVQAMAETGVKVTEVVSARDAALAKLTGIYDYWLDYPPDWENRRRTALDQSSYCEECGDTGSRRKPLHVHHRKPLSAGGNNLPSNLIVLCEHCHSRRHGGMQFDYESARRAPNAFSERTVLIEQAIRERKLVHFQYRRYSGGRSVRSVQPASIGLVRDALCMTGYCHLRQEARTFAIARMSSIEIVDGPKKSYRISSPGRRRGRPRTSALTSHLPKIKPRADVSD